MPIWVVYTARRPPQFPLGNASVLPRPVPFASVISLDNVKVTLVLAETKDEGKVVVRVVFTNSRKIDNLMLCAVVPFEAAAEKPVLKQKDLLNKEKNEKIGLTMIFRNIKFRFHDAKKEERKLILLREDANKFNISEGDVREVNIPREDEIEINQMSFTRFPKTHPESSIITLGFGSPIRPGTYAIKFLFYTKNIGEEFFEHWMFEKGTSISIPVFYKCELRDKILEEFKIEPQSTVDPDYIEFFLYTPSNVVTSRPKPEEYEYLLFKKYEEVTLGKIMDQKMGTAASDYDYEPHRGRNQFKWKFGRKGGLISLRFLKPPILPIFLFYSVLLFNLLIGLYIFEKFEISPRFSFLVSIFWILLLNYFVFSLIRKPSILGVLSKTMVRIGYTNIFWQIFGCILFISVECVILGLEKTLESPLILIGTGLFGFIYVFLVEFRSGLLPEIIRKKFLELNPSKWEIIEYVVFSWNLFLYSAAITVAAFGTDFLVKLGIFPGLKLEIAVFFSLVGLGAFGGKIIEIIKGEAGT